MGFTEADLQQFLKNPHVKEHGKPFIPKAAEGKIQVTSSPPTPKKKKMTGAEREAGNMLELEFAGCRVVFHGLAFYLDNGHTYTPDWTVHLSEGKILVVEVKSRGKTGYRQPSYNRSMCMFDQSRVEWPMFSYRVMEKFNGEWIIKNF